MTITTKEGKAGRISGYYVDGQRVLKKELEAMLVGGVDEIITVDYNTALTLKPMSNHQVMKNLKVIVTGVNNVRGGELMTRKAIEAQGLELGWGWSGQIAALWRVKDKADMPAPQEVTGNVDEAMTEAYVTAEAMDAAIEGETAQAAQSANVEAEQGTAAENSHRFMVRAYTTKTDEFGVIGNGSEMANVATAQQAAQFVIDFAAQNNDRTVTGVFIKDFDTYKEYRATDADLKAIDNPAGKHIYAQYVDLFNWLIRYQREHDVTDAEAEKAFLELYISNCEDMTPEPEEVKAKETEVKAVSKPYSINPAEDAPVRFNHLNIYFRADGTLELEGYFECQKIETAYRRFKKAMAQAASEVPELKGWGDDNAWPPAKKLTLTEDGNFWINENDESIFYTRNGEETICVDINEDTFYFFGYFRNFKPAIETTAAHSANVEVTETAGNEPTIDDTAEDNICAAVEEVTVAVEEPTQMAEQVAPIFKCEAEIIKGLGEGTFTFSHAENTDGTLALHFDFMPSSEYGKEATLVEVYTDGTLSQLEAIIDGNRWTREFVNGEEVVYFNGATNFIWSDKYGAGYSVVKQAHLLVKVPDGQWYRFVNFAVGDDEFFKLMAERVDTEEPEPTNPTEAAAAVTAEESEVTAEETKTFEEITAAYAKSRDRVRMHFTAKGNVTWQNIYHYGRHGLLSGAQRISKEEAAEILAEYGLTCEQVIAVEKAIETLKREERAAARRENRRYNGRYIYVNARAMVFGEEAEAIKKTAQGVEVTAEEPEVKAAKTTKEVLAEMIGKLGDVKVTTEKRMTIITKKVSTIYEAIEILNSLLPNATYEYDTYTFSNDYKITYRHFDAAGVKGAHCYGMIEFISPTANLRAFVSSTPTAKLRLTLSLKAQHPLKSGLSHDQ